MSDNNDSESKQWKCEKCNYTNKSDATDCVMCLGLHCSKCVLYKNNESLKCDKCDAHKRIIQTFEYLVKEGDNTKAFSWVINALFGQTKIEKKKENKKEIFTINKRPKDDTSDNESDEKSDNNEKNGNESENKNEKSGTLTLLIRFERAKDRKEGMCPEGHCYFGSENYCKQELDEWPSNMQWQCMECKSNKNLKACWDCFRGQFAKPRVLKGKQTNFRNGFGVIYIACMECRLLNLKKLEFEAAMDNIKRNMIRRELVLKPGLSLDLLCGLGRAKALEKVISDIGHLEGQDRNEYCLFLFDLDDLKALNSTLGNTGADCVIENVGKVLRDFTQQINDGKWKKNRIKKAYAFRQGGDEFALLLWVGGRAEQRNLYDFFMECKNRINNLVKCEFMNKYRKEVDLETISVLKERKLKKILTSMNGIDISDEIKESIKETIYQQKIHFSITKIGISVGLFIPKRWAKEKNWIECAEKAQTMAKTIKGKNEIGIWYEGFGGIVPANKTQKCLKKGCKNGMEF